MTCLHKPGDPNCGSSPQGRQRAICEAVEAERAAQPKTPTATDYEIVEAQRVGSHLVVKVLYPNCRKCSYEGNKIIVFLNVDEVAAMKWREIDPHFRDPKKHVGQRAAPPPAARFPASEEGWQDALAYAASKKGSVTR